MFVVKVKEHRDVCCNCSNCRVARAKDVVIRGEGTGRKHVTVIERDAALKHDDGTADDVREDRDEKVCKVAVVVS